MKGAGGFGIIRFQGSIGSISAFVLLDGGSTDNFIQPRIVHCLKMPIEAAPKWQVLVGNGQKMTAEGMLKDLALSIDEHEIKVSAYLH